MPLRYLTEKCHLVAMECRFYRLGAGSVPLRKSTDERNHKMKPKAVFYHAGCPVCVSAEQQVLGALDTNRYEIEVVHLGDDKSRLAEAEAQGVQSVPALALDGQAFHINFGASLSDLK